MLRQSAVGFGSLALTALLAEESKPRGRGRPANPLAPRPPHFPARAKRIIFLFMKGGPSHVDTFDPKPQLQRDDGKPLPFAKPRVQFAETGMLLGSPWKFKKYGRERDRGQRAVSPRGPAASTTSASSTRCTAPTRPTAGPLLKLHTGSDNFVRPSMGSWVTYGLGSENENLPGFVTICPTLAHGGVIELELGLPAGRLPGNAAGQRQRSRRARPGSATSRTRGSRRDVAAHRSSTCSPR